MKNTSLKFLSMVLAVSAALSFAGYLYATTIISSPNVGFTVNEYVFSLAVDKTSVAPGDTVTYTATFTKNGAPVSGEPIDLINKINQQTVDTDTTNANGICILTWVASGSGTINFQAKTIVGSTVKTSNEVSVSINQYTVTLTIDKASGEAGETVTFTATVLNNGVPISGKTVSLIKNVNSQVLDTDTTNESGICQLTWVASGSGYYEFHAETTV